MIKNLCVFCGSNPGVTAAFAQSASTVGQLLGRRGIGLVYGGGKVGLMGILADACLQTGGQVIGVIPKFLADREVAHPGLSELHIVESMHQRKALMAQRSDAFLALPGGFGTWEELMEVLTWTQLGLQHKTCAVLNVHGYYDPLLALVARANQEGFVRDAHLDFLLQDSDSERLIDRLSSAQGQL
jgi:uncharacterized protein (TIGR00730 family)